MMLYDQIKSDIIIAMKSGNKKELIILRCLDAQIQLKIINSKLSKVDINDDLIVNIISKELKEINESIQLSKTNNRQDLVDKNEFEIVILSKYLPKQIEGEELKNLVINRCYEIKEKNLQVEDKKLVGIVMKTLSLELKGKCDMKVVGKYVQETFN